MITETASPPPPTSAREQAKDAVWSAGAAAATVAAVVALVGIGRPAYWLDELATVDAVTRSWSDLLSLIWVREGPIGAYYLLLKPLASVSTAEWWLRLPSALAVVLAATVLATTVARRTGPLAGAGAGIAFVLVPSVSRYAHEARPYALGLLGLVIFAALWLASDARPSSPRKGVVLGGGLALSVAFSLSMNVVTAVVVAALCAVRLFDVRPGWWSRLVRTVLWTAAGVLLASPQVYLALTGAVGVANPPERGWASISAAATDPLQPTAVLVVVVVLALIGLARAADPRARSVVLLGGGWALLAPLLLAVGAFVQPSLAISRYWLFLVPGWAVLAGIGLSVLAAWVAPRGGRKPSAVAALALLTVVLSLAGQEQQILQRATNAHEEEDARPVMSALSSPPYDGLPVIALPAEARFAMAAYAPEAMDRLVLAQDPLPVGQLILPDVPAAVAQERLEGVDEVAVVVFRDPEARLAAYEALAPFEERERVSGDLWTLLLMDRRG